MSKLSGQQIKTLAKEIVKRSPGGIRFSALVNEIVRLHPETPPNTISGNMWNLEVQFPAEISKPSRGLFKSTVGAGEERDDLEAPPEAEAHLAEEDFYDSFGEWLKNELGEVIEVRALGGAGLRSKWGTPDVVGVYKARAADLIKFPSEIVAAEVKIDLQGSVVAFGQAVVYRLFASKTYIAMPTTISQIDLDRLEALCLLFGVGLAVFNPDKERPGYAIKVRAQRFSPDMFYVNEFAERLKEHDPETFEALFG